MDYIELLPDAGCDYDGEMELDLSTLEPLCACPHLPDNVKPLREVEKKKVQQVFIGSCTNSSYADIAKATLVFRGHHVAEDVSCTCGVSSRQSWHKTKSPFLFIPIVERLTGVFSYIIMCYNSLVQRIRMD